MGGRGGSSASAKKNSGGQFSQAVKNRAEKLLLESDTYNADSISRKQAGVIFAAYKRGDLKASESIISNMYDNWASYGRPGLTTDAHAKQTAGQLKLAVDAIFQNDYEVASYFMDRFDRNNRMFYEG